MLTVRILQNTKHLTKYICVSNVIKRAKSDDPDTPPAVNNITKKPDSKSQEKVKPKKEVGADPMSTNSKRQSFSSSGKPKAEKKARKFKSDFFKNLMEASAENVAQEFKGDTKKTKSDLLGYLKTFEVSREVQEETTRQAFAISSQPSVHTIFKNVEPLRIFKFNQLGYSSEQVNLNTWKHLEAEDLAYNSEIAPANYFEEQIQWTKEGRLWHFPIDNDQGLEKEAEVSFTEHIFLEKHLEPWCPKKGPLRKFMEMVLIGLAKNPYISIEDKKEHIEWFKNYFENKKKLLQELGAFGVAKEIESAKQEAKSPE